MESLESAYQTLLAAKEFKKKGFLCSVFLMAAPKELFTQPWQFDFYDPVKKTMTSYAVGKTIEMKNADTEVFQEEEKEIQALDLQDVKVAFSRAFTIVNDKMGTRHESVTKFIVLLQKLDVPLWNMSALTDAFNLVNVRIDARDGNIIEEKVFPMLSWKT